MAGRAVELPDIGTTLQAKIVELVETGDIAALAKLRERVPRRPRGRRAPRGHRAQARDGAVDSELGVASVDDLAAALADGRVREVPGFGAATEARLAAELARHAAAEADGEERVPIGSALPVAEEIARDLREAVPGARVEVAGSLRRGRESVHDIDLVAAADRPEELQDALAVHPAVERELSRGDASASVATHAGVRLELAVGAPESFGNLLQHATGSAAHNIRLRELAVRQGLSVSQHGILGPDGERADPRRRGGRLRRARAPPRAARAARGPRRDRGGARGAAAAARGARRPARATCTPTRGGATARGRSRQMVEAARERGYAYLAISDHSQSLAMAGGLDADRVRRQWEEIDAENARRDDIVVLKATEVDILADGRLDFEDELLAGFDWVTASVHSAFGQDGGALHGAGCSRPSRARSSTSSATPPAGCSGGAGTRRSTWRGLIEAAAAESGTYLEVNAQPQRLDLDADMARQALAGGARITIGSDAHSERRLRLHPLRAAGGAPGRRAARGRRQHPALGRAGGRRGGRGSRRRARGQ